MTEATTPSLFHEPHRMHTLQLGGADVCIDSQFGQSKLQLSLEGQSLQLNAEECMTLASALIAHAERLSPSP